MKFVIFLIGIFATSIVIYNNMKQLWEGTNNIYDIISFGIVVLATIGYYTYNRKQIKW